MRLRSSLSIVSMLVVAACGLAAPAATAAAAPVLPVSPPVSPPAARSLAPMRDTFELTVPTPFSNLSIDTFIVQRAMPDSVCVERHSAAIEGRTFRAASGLASVAPSAVRSPTTGVGSDRREASHDTYNPLHTLPFAAPFLIGMTALAKDRDTQQRSGGRRAYGVAATKKIYQGSLVMVDAGFAKPGAAAVGKIAVGRACATVDNTAGANGDLTVEVETGEFSFNNSAAGDLLAIADIGADCYIVDDQTVAKTDGSGTRSRAGKVANVDSAGVWVSIGIGT